MDIMKNGYEIMNHKYTINNINYSDYNEMVIKVTFEIEEVKLNSMLLKEVSSVISALL